MFEGARLGKNPREKSEEITSFYEKKGVPVSDQRDPEYSAYAVYYGWMENQELADIESKYKVYASRCPQVAKELFNLLNVYERLAIKKSISVPADFKEFKDRVRYGVTTEELPFRRLRGIGRPTTRKMKMYCESFRNLPWNLSGSMLEIFVQIYKRDGEKRFSELLQFVKGVGKGKKHKKILDLVKSVAEKK
ncbi:MAG: hypothetical protein ACP5LB_02590 [Candidatus Bathyarchaeia archaeon]